MRAVPLRTAVDPIVGMSMTAAVVSKPGGERQARDSGPIGSQHLQLKVHASVCCRTSRLDRPAVGVCSAENGVLGAGRARGYRKTAAITRNLNWFSRISSAFDRRRLQVEWQLHARWTEGLCGEIWREMATAKLSGFR
jgi:hypothetical protein